jgi:hypothetical protein
MAIPARATITPPAASAPSQGSQRSAATCTGLIRCASAITTAAAAAAKSAADSTRPPSRWPPDSGRVRRNRSQAVARSSAMPTPNWKNATPRMARGAGGG